MLSPVVRNFHLIIVGGGRNVCDFLCCPQAHLDTHMQSHTLCIKLCVINSITRFVLDLVWFEVL